MFSQPSSNFLPSPLKGLWKAHTKAVDCHLAALKFHKLNCIRVHIGLKKHRHNIDRLSLSFHFLDKRLELHFCDKFVHYRAQNTRDQSLNRRVAGAIAGRSR